MKNIGILEMRYHIKFLHTMMRICKTKDTNVTVFTTEKIYKRIETYLDDPKKYTIVLKKDNETISSFLKKVEKVCDEKKIDLLFVNTIEFSLIDIPHYIRFKSKTKMILTIHVANHWLKARFSLNLKNIFRTVDTNASILLRPFVLKKFNAINVIYSPVRDYVKEQTNYKKPVYIFPFNFYDGHKIDIGLKDEKIRFIIPGLIEEYRRDYHTALDVFEKLFDKYNDKIMLTLMGEPVGTGGKKIIQRCEHLKDKGYNISFSKEFVPEKEYDQALTESDIIFSPLNVVNNRDTGIKEIYGKTEGSALPFEAIQYGKPIIVPKEFAVIKELKTSALQYDSPENLEKLLLNIIENKKDILVLKQEAYKNSQNFSIEVLQRYFSKEILNNLDKL